MDSVEQSIMDGCYNILDVVYSPDGSRFSYSWDVDSTKQRAIIDGIVYSYPKISKIIFSHDGKHFGFIAAFEKGKNSKLNIDGDIISKYDYIGLDFAFSPKDNKPAFIVYDEDKMYYVIGDKEFNRYDSIYPKLIEFNEDGVLRFFAIDGQDVYHVTFSPAD
jgi:hypothetical protein